MGFPHEAVDALRVAHPREGQCLVSLLVTGSPESDDPQF